MKSGIYKLQTLVEDGMFEVPDYQRFYSWEEEHLEDLWTDLENLTETKKHYFGTVILQETDETVETGGEFASQLDVYRIIDGQQRLTTVAILLRCLTDYMDELATKLEDPDARSQAEEKARRIETKFLKLQDVYRLKLLGDDQDFFETHIVEGVDFPRTEITPSQHRLFAAKEFFEDRFDDILREIDDEAAFLQECNAIWNKIASMELMTYVVDADDQGRATLIFESVNDRGKNLSELEKTKSFLMHRLYLTSDEEDGSLGTRLGQVRTSFKKMYRHIQAISESKQGEGVSEDNILQYHYISFSDWSKTEHYQNVLDHLKTVIRDLYEEDKERCSQYILEYCRSLEAAFQGMRNLVTYQGSGDVEHYLDRLYKLGNVANFYPILIQTWDHLDDDERAELLKTVERYVFRVYSVANYRADTGVTKLHRKARDFYGESKGIDAWTDAIHAVIWNYADDATFEETLQRTNFLRRVGKDVKYLLYFYNEHLAEEDKEPARIELDDFLSKDFEIEHIWPKNPQDDLPPELELEHQRNLDRLGNLTVASKSWNARWGNKPFSEKKREYDRSSLRVQNVLGQYETDTWREDQIDRREQLIRDFATDFWAIPVPDDAAPVEIEEE